MSSLYKTEIMDASSCLTAVLASQNPPSSWEFISGFALKKDDAENLVVTMRKTVKTQQHKQFNPVATLG